MGDRGRYQVDRSDWDDPELVGREPWSRIMAWHWLIGEAAWQPRTVRIGSRSIPLKLGQYACSSRYLANRWRWPKSNVDRFIEKLREQTRIEPSRLGSGGASITIITICNYDRIKNDAEVIEPTPEQTNGPTQGHQAGQQTGHQSQVNTETYDISRANKRDNKRAIDPDISTEKQTKK